MVTWPSSDETVATVDSSGKVTSIGLNNGVHIDLATGNLFVDENASFDVLFSVVNAGQYFISDGIFFPNIKIRLSSSKYEGGGTVTETEDNQYDTSIINEVVEWDVRPELLYTDGTVN